MTEQTPENPAETPREVIERLRGAVHDLVPHLMVELGDDTKPVTPGEEKRAAGMVAALDILDQVDVLLDEVTPKD